MLKIAPFLAQLTLILLSKCGSNQPLIGRAPEACAWECTTVQESRKQRRGSPDRHPRGLCRAGTEQGRRLPGEKLLLRCLLQRGSAMESWHTAVQRSTKSQSTKSFCDVLCGALNIQTAVTGF